MDWDFYADVLAYWYVNFSLKSNKKFNLFTKIATYVIATQNEYDKTLKRT